MFFWGAHAARERWQSPFVYDPFSFRSVTSWPHLERQANQPTESLMTEESRSIHSHALPNYERAEIPRSKLEGYALNPVHEPDGKHKARVLKARLVSINQLGSC
jgi:hypothetical protein